LWLIFRKRQKKRVGIRTAICRGQSVLLEPAFYEQLGQDPAEIIEQAKQALVARYGPPSRG
jgi:hypothetical protein